MTIKELVRVRAQPTVVRLDSLHAEHADWITERFFVTPVLGEYLASLRTLLAAEHGCGVFVIGQYGSGKSHFLGYLAQQITAGAFATPVPRVIPLSLLNFEAARTLESIVLDHLGGDPTGGDRRATWAALAASSPAGIVLLIDELSEFLRSKASRSAFNEDLRFLQFLGEWAQDRPLWVVAALQEQIEHAGEIEYELFRKIKDRYPIRYLLSPAHVRELIADKILVKAPGYATAVEELVQALRRAFPAAEVDFAGMSAIYPIHPATLELLEEVRDRFSQARGVIDFTLTQLLGNPERGVASFLEEPWGRLLGPDSIVDHFRDLFEVQPEFLPLAQRVLPYYRRQMAELFAPEVQRALAWRILKLLVLCDLSPAREGLTAEQAAWWLLHKATTIAPEKNVELVRGILGRLAAHGAFVVQRGSAFLLDPGDDSRASFESLLERTLAELGGDAAVLLERLAPVLGAAPFNPFELDRNRWRTRFVRWHFHDRKIDVLLGDEGVAPAAGLSLQVALPWGPEGILPGCFRFVPGRIEDSADLRELGALLMLRDRPLDTRIAARVAERLARLTELFVAQVESAYRAGKLLTPQGKPIEVPAAPMRSETFATWLDRILMAVLRTVYPAFERFAPAYGPLSAEVYKSFLTAALERGLGEPDAPEPIPLIREAYLVPMKLLRRQGRGYVTVANLDSHELVTVIRPVLRHGMAPAQVYETLGDPIFGLVPDQIHLLLMLLLIQGEIEILKGDRSLRDSFATLVNPQKYDRIVPGRALGVTSLQALEALCTGFELRIPGEWTVLAQRRVIRELGRVATQRRDALLPFVMRLQNMEGTAAIRAQVEALVATWGLLTSSGSDEIEAFQSFLQRIGSPAQLIAESRRLGELPQRIEGILAQRERLQHVLGTAAIEHCVDRTVNEGLAALGPAPPIDDTDALDAWLRKAEKTYERYEQWYAAAHDSWWSVVAGDPLWTYVIPDVALCANVGTAALAAALQQALSEAVRGRCGGLSRLAFQSTCRCGFDGLTAPVSRLLRRAAEMRDQLQIHLRAYFADPSVRECVQRWVSDGIDTDAEATEYLAGRRDWPEAHRPALLNDYLAGVEVVSDLDGHALLRRLAGKIWDRRAFLRELETFVGGERGFFRVISLPPAPAAAGAPSDELVVWCIAQALTAASALPPGLPPSSLAAAAKSTAPEWVSPQALARLSQLNLGSVIEDTILGWIIDGKVAAPRSQTAAPDLVRGAAAAAMMQIPSSPEELAELAALLYSVDRRCRAARKDRWQAYVERVAAAPCAAGVRPLVAVLEASSTGQWVILDAFGIPLLSMVRAALPRWFPGRTVTATAFAEVSLQTTTSAFNGLLATLRPGVAPLKLDAIDKLLHERSVSFGELERLAEAEVAVALDRVRGQLDAAKPVILFSDHGFRLSADGRRFTHGGASTLERLVPVLTLSPVA
ncbi:MAG: hypothetical protein HYV63_25115 [Candidatus Schekmanbacteria bacterium]|nr:hypothetical protein [Candidatus Schekmanbacteria bacterium]